MAQNTHIEQQLEQQLQQRLSPLQVRYVRMLEMNRAEAEEAVERELAENPALEREALTAPQATEEGERWDETSDELLSKDYASAEDIPYYRLNQPQNRREITWQPQQADGEDLLDSLLHQIGELDLEPDVRALAEYIAGNLDERGFLTRTPAAMLSDIEIDTGREITTEQMQRALEAVRSLEPAGIGAEDTRQSLLLQLRRMPRSRRRDDAMRIISETWDMFVKKHGDRIASRLRIGKERTLAALSLIRRLNPKPGGSLSSQAGAAPVMPDYAVDVEYPDRISVSLPGMREDLSVESSFESAMALINSGARKRIAGADYITARYNDARDFISLIRQRRDTMLATITAITALQKDYFLTDDDSLLKPMTLKDVAAIAGYDQSTISRATNGKYVQTRAGILPLSHFFSEGLRGEGGDEVSSRKVQAALKALVDAEPGAKPLSDEVITRSLKEQGFSVSRRTVAKYRDRMGIPVARLRKKIIDKQD